MTLPPIPVEGPPTLGIVGDDGLITAKRHTRGHCPSHRFMIDVDNRTVQCKACLKMFDPIEALLYFAKWGERWRGERDGLNREIKAKTAVLDELDRRLKNTKATARRHKVAIPTAWDVLRSVPPTPPEPRKPPADPTGAEPPRVPESVFCLECNAEYQPVGAGYCPFCKGLNWRARP